MKIGSAFVFSLLSFLFAVQPAWAQIANGVEIGDGLTASICNGKQSKGQQVLHQGVLPGLLSRDSGCNGTQVLATDTNGATVFSIPIDHNPGVYEYSRSIALANTCVQD